jgi:hypothetical protein
MRGRPRQQGSWLFPVMVIAAASVVAFGAYGVAVVTGHLRGGGAGTAPRDGGGLVTAEAGAQAKGVTAAKGPAGGVATAAHN